MKIEEVRGPDHLDQQGKGKKQLKEYLEEGTIKPVTGDQGGVGLYTNRLPYMPAC